MVKSHAHHLKNAERIANLLDNKFGIGKFRFGIDPLLGLIPGGGDVISTILSAYIVWIGLQVGVPTHRIIQMIGNIVIDFLIGLIPFIGDLFDFTIKANLKNLEIIKRHLGTEAEDGVLL